MILKSFAQWVRETLRTPAGLVFMELGQHHAVHDTPHRQICRPDGSVFCDYLDICLDLHGLTRFDLSS